MGARTLLLTHASTRSARCPAIRPSAAWARGTWSGRSTPSTASWAGSPTRPASSSGCSTGRKGPAVRGPRAQADRKLYRQAMQAAIAGDSEPDRIEDGVEDLIVDETGVSRRRDRVGADLARRRRGAHDRHVPEGPHPYRRERIPAGRVGEAPAIGLSDRLRGWASRWAGSRPARRRGSTAARSTGRALEMQPGDDPPMPFSFLTERSRRRRSPAASPGRRRATHEIIRDNLHRAPVYSGADQAAGRAIARRSKTRWCASPTASATRSSSSPKGSTTTRSIRTASPPRCPRTCSGPSSHDPRAREGRDQPARLCDRIRLCRSARARSRPGD